MELTCYRDAALSQEARTLPAATYNLAITLLEQTPHGCLFVPIRSMQYLAVIDHEEFVFIDGMRKCWIDIAWRQFHPQQRHALNEAVNYLAVNYQAGSAALMPRLQAELARALTALSLQQRPLQPARVLKFPGTRARS